MAAYLVWNPEAKFPTVAHTSRESAVRESERLARENPGQHFYVMEPGGVSYVEKPQIFRDFKNEIPF